MYRLMKFFLSVLLTSILMCSPAWAQSFSFAPVGYQNALPQLEQSGVPLRLPKVLVAPGAEGVYGATLSSASPAGYSIIVGNRYPCGGTACAQAYVEAVQLSPNLPPVEQMFNYSPDPDGELAPLRSPEQPGWYSLPNGQPVYFSPWESYMGAGFSYLVWDEEGYRYSVSLRVGTLNNLFQMVVSAFQ